MLATAAVKHAPATSSRPGGIMRPDDQGHGEVGFHGNPLKEIPPLDGLSRAKH